MYSKVGILAGMGPRSTAPLIDLVAGECTVQYGAKYDMDFPAMLIYSLPTPFYPDRPVDHTSLRSAILKGLKELESFGVDFIVMPCNIAHLYYEALQSDIHVPLLNIVDETVTRIPAGYRSAALFAARGTVESGLYQQGIIQSGRTTEERPEWQNAIDRLIMAVKQTGCTDSNRKAMAELISDALHCADCVIIGCTDLTPLVSQSEEIKVLDSASCLASATVARYVEIRKTKS